MNRRLWVSLAQQILMEHVSLSFLVVSLRVGRIPGHSALCCWEWLGPCVWSSILRQQRFWPVLLYIVSSRWDKALCTSVSCLRPLVLLQSLLENLSFFIAISFPSQCTFNPPKLNRASLSICTSTYCGLDFYGAGRDSRSFLLKYCLPSHPINLQAAIFRGEWEVAGRACEEANIPFV